MKKRYLLDTNVLISHQRGALDLSAVLNAKGIYLSQCYISEITWIEMTIGDILARHKGIHNRQSSEKLLCLFNMLPITSCLNLFCEEKCRLQIRGTPQENNFDLLIGCTGVANNMVVVTDNVKDFKNIKGIRLESWNTP